jgi:inner membrane protein involved in colicin E2 resistance
MRLGQWTLLMVVLIVLSSVLFSLDQVGHHAVAWGGELLLVGLLVMFNRRVARNTRGSHE